jgi:uncharacterized protein YxjI
LNLSFPDLHNKSERLPGNSPGPAFALSFAQVKNIRYNEPKDLSSKTHKKKGDKSMKLYIKQRVFSWNEKFAIWDEQENQRWFAQGEYFSWGHKLHITDPQGREVAFIRQKLLALLPQYVIEIGGNSYKLTKEISLLTPRYCLGNANWAISGNFNAHEYAATKGNEQMMSIRKHWFTFGDSYELTITRLEDELLGLCTALAIDCVNAS